MAHFAKYKAGALGNMTAHYDRTAQARGVERANIDEARTPLNYNLAPQRDCSQVEYINQRIDEISEGRKVRKDAVRMVDCVLTLPDSFDPARADEFFAAAYGELSARFGGERGENIVSAWVHMDETTPHMHFAFVPVTSDGRLSAKDVLNREMLQTFHVDLRVEMERALGVPCDVLLPEERAEERALSKIPQKDLTAARNGLESLREQQKLEAQRLECLRRARIAVEAKLAHIEEKAKAVPADGLDGAIERARSDVQLHRAAARRADAELRADRLNARKRALEREVGELRERVRDVECRRSGLGGSCERLRARVKHAMTRLGYVPFGMSERVVRFGKALGLVCEEPSPDRYYAVTGERMSPTDLSVWATKEAKKFNEGLHGNRGKRRR